MLKRRAFMLLLVFTICIGVLLVRLFSLQMKNSMIDVRAASSSMLHQALEQRMEQLVIDAGRGHFYDRNMYPLTGETYEALAVFPKRMNEFLKKNQTIDFHTMISQVVPLSLQEWSAWLDDTNPPFLWKDQNGKPYRLKEEQIKEIDAWQIPGLHVIPYVERYRSPYLAAHLIGFIGEHPERIKQMYGTWLTYGKVHLDGKLGGSGLERSFDPFIIATERTKASIAYFVDGHSNTVKGLNKRWLPRSTDSLPLKIVTTIDRNIQRAVENIADRADMKDGAIVILDVKQADVVAMVSRPVFDPYTVDPDDDAWNNKAVQAFVPGSIFKTVVAAAALEHGTFRRNEKFFCNGEWGRYGFRCWQRAGHGELSLEQAFAQSCNITFAQLALRLGADRLEHMAHQLGFGTTVGWSADVSWNDMKWRPFRQLLEEQPGQLFADQTPRNDEGVLIQTAIGQRDVRVTPLQAANLIVTLLNDGKVLKPRVVREVRDQNHFVVKRFHPHAKSKQRAVSRQTAREITRWMRTVVTEGTGQMLRKTTWPVAGKTGTAQAGSIGGKAVYHQWFIGYGPVYSPRYAVAVLVHQTDGRQGHLATNIFGQLMDELARLEDERIIVY